MDYTVQIEKALAKAKYAPEGKTALFGYDLLNGMIIRIEYYTVGKTNICDNWREVTSEQWDWERAGCKNNEEWHRHLEKNFWADFSAGLKRENAI